MLLLTIFFHWKVTKNQRMAKVLSFETTCGFLMQLLTLRWGAPYIWFSELFQFQPIFGYFLSRLERKIKFIKFSTKFQITEIKFLVSRYTSLLLRNKPVQGNLLQFFKNFTKQCVLQGLMKLKLLRETLSLTTFLHQEVRKNLKKDKRILF